MMTFTITILNQNKMKFIKILFLVVIFLVLTPIKWLSTIIIELFTFIEFKIADYTIFFLNNIKSE